MMTPLIMMYQPVKDSLEMPFGHAPFVSAECGRAFHQLIRQSTRSEKFHHRYSEEPAAEETALLNGVKGAADPVSSSQGDAQAAITEVQVC